RKRLSQACINCHHKKIKCDGTRPHCNNCIKNHLPCSFPLKTNKRGPRQGYIEKLEQRLERIE
ncbi:nuclear protein, partial [Conidiobolus coronatus NRRL 28638]